MHRIPWKLLIALLVIGALVAAVWYATRPDPVPVALAAVEPGLVRATVANTRAGTVEACRRARISPEAGGQVARLTVSEGDRVQGGQLLLELWNEDLVAGLRLAEQEAVMARARAEDACIRANDASREARRLERLHQRGLTSDDQLDRASTEAEAQAAACRAAQAAVQVSEASVDVKQAGIGRTRLVAPFTGVVAEVNAELGEYVTPSPPGIATPPAVDLIDDNCLYITAPIDEVDAAVVRIGQRALITLDALRERTFEGTVRRIAPYVVDVAKQARTVDVEVDFTNPGETGELLVGYSADVEIVLEERRNVLRVPTEAVLEGNRVLAYDEVEGELAERTFTPGLANWEYTEVTDGLAAGDRVVTSVGREGVEAGVRAVPEAEGGADQGS